VTRAVVVWLDRKLGQVSMSGIRKRLIRKKGNLTEKERHFLAIPNTGSQ
jgi:hypothetical protein